MVRTLRSSTKAIFLLCALLLASCPNPLMNAIKTKVSNDTGKSLNSFVFTAAANARLYTDVQGSINDTAYTISLSVPKWVPLTSLVATFQFQGASVTVNGAAQTSGITAQSFSQPVVYTVTPQSGQPVKYTVTATTGPQGLMGGVIQGTPLSLSGAVSTTAGLASAFGNPMGVVEVSGNLYVADSQFSVIWKVNAATGAVTLYAGILGSPGFADAASGPPTSAQFNTPAGLATDGSNLYIADQGNERIRMIALSSGDVTTLAGSGTQGHGDAIGTAATFSGPNGLYFDGTSTLYETDKISKIVRTIDLTAGPTYGTVTTIVPFGNTYFAAPAGLVLFTVSSSTYLYVVDEANNAVYQFGPLPSFSVTASGNPFVGLAAGLNTPTGIVAFSNFLYVADAGNDAIQKVDPSNGSATTYFGASGQNGHVDGLGASSMRFDTPNMLWVQTGSPSYMYITEGGNTDIRSIQLTTVFSSTLAGVPPGSSNGTGSAATFYSPRQMASNGTTVWISDQLNQLLRSLTTAAAAVGALAGQTGNAAEQDGTGAGAALNYPAGMTTDGKFLYVCDQFGMTIRKVNIATGAVTTIAGAANQAGFVDNVGTSARFQRPTGITTDGTSLYVVDQANNAIRKIDLGTLQVTTIAGSLSAASGDTDNAVGTLALFNTPGSVTTDGTSLFVTDIANNKIRKISLPGYSVSTLAGPLPGSHTAGYANGAGTHPFSIPR